MQKQFLEIGKIVNVQGLKGEVKVMHYCDSVDFLCEFDELYLGDKKEIIEVENARIHKNMAILKFKGIDNIDDANKLRNSILYMNRDDVELEEDSYFVQDLIGLSVYDVDSNVLYGKIDDVLQTGANDVYSIKGEDRTYLVPAIADVVIETDIDNATMKIRPLRGLFDED
ncbi:MAG TPA: 16S rRNA processing protein RimM [Clostridiales bacterium]|nr:16S rRNA processing protein RimM [Clostridiales bacterium]